MTVHSYWMHEPVMCDLPAPGATKVLQGSSQDPCVCREAGAWRLTLVEWQIPGKSSAGAGGGMEGCWTGSGRRIGLWRSAESVASVYVEFQGPSHAAANCKDHRLSLVQIFLDPLQLQWPTLGWGNEYPLGNIQLPQIPAGCIIAYARTTALPCGD